MSKIVSVILGKNKLILHNTLVHDVLNITVGEEAIPLSIFNILGQLIYPRTVKGNQELNLSTLAAGLYIIRTSAGEAGRFVKD